MADPRRTRPRPTRRRAQTKTSASLQRLGEVKRPARAHPGRLAPKLRLRKFFPAVAPACGGEMGADLSESGRPEGVVQAVYTF